MDRTHRRPAGLLAAAIALVLAAPAAGAGEEPPPRSDRPTGSAAAPGKVMAYVNGRPIAMEALTDILVSAYGKPVADQLVAMELAGQAAAKAGVRVTQDDIDAEHALTLKQMFRRLGPSTKAEEALDRFLAQKHMSRGLWRVIMRRNALLRKLAPKEIRISDAEIREQFGRIYGRKVVVRHIQVDSLPDAQKVKELADKGIDFTLLVTRYSTHESKKNGGMLPPIGRGTEQLTPALRNAALAMKKIGEVSNPIQAGTKFHILKLEKIIEPRNVKYADVKDKIADAIREGRIRLFQNRMLQQLIADAKIEYVQPILKSQDEKAKAEAAKKAEAARKAETGTSTKERP